MLIFAGLVSATNKSPLSSYTPPCVVDVATELSQTELDHTLLLPPTVIESLGLEYL